MGDEKNVLAEFANKKLRGGTRRLSPRQFCSPSGFVLTRDPYHSWTPSDSQRDRYIPPATGLSTLTTPPTDAAAGKHFAFNATPRPGSVSTPVAGHIDAVPRMGFEPSSVYKSVEPPSGQLPFSNRSPVRLKACR